MWARELRSVRGRSPYAWLSATGVGRLQHSVALALRIAAFDRVCMLVYLGEYRGYLP